MEDTAQTLIRLDLNEMVLMGTQDTCFDWLIRKYLKFYTPKKFVYLGLSLSYLSFEYICKMEVLEYKSVFQNKPPFFIYILMT